jgi:hypothetical protein
MTAKYPANCENCGARSMRIALDGGGYVVAYSCTHEFVVATPGASRTIIKTCPEPKSTREAL